MNTPSPFMVAREASNNLSNSFNRVRDENAIERILSESINSGDPQVLQNNIGKILSQVSPERHGAAISYLENAYSNIQKRQQQERLAGAEREAGVTPGLPPAVQAQQLKNKVPPKPVGGLAGQAVPQEISVSIPKILEATKEANADQLAIALDKAGIPRAYSNSYIESRRRQDEAKANQNQARESDFFKSNLARSSKIKDRADKIAETLPQKRTAINLMNDAISNKDLSFWSRDNLAEITGIEGLRSPEGAIFKTAGKEYFLGSIARAGARPNQWIEQQIADMMTKVGRSTEANLSVARALENELDLEEATVRLTEEISDRLLAEGDYSQSKLGSILNKELSSYAERKQQELFNDLRAIKSIGENSPQKFHKVEKGTPVSRVVAQAILRQFNNDPEKASQEAIKLGYTFE